VQCVAARDVGAGWGGLSRKRGVRLIDLKFQLHFRTDS
jgi:hypothetical protein